MTAAQDAATWGQADASGPSSERHEAREGVLSLGSMSLHFGGSLETVKLAWRAAGPSDAPTIVALGGISAGRYVTSDATRKGWWSEIVSPSGPLDSSRYRIIGMDFLGGSGETTGPAAGQVDFPAISAYDQAYILNLLLQQLGISRVVAIVGASYGGMVALAFAERFPSHVDRVVSISAADRSHPMSTAWRSVQRAIVRYALSKNDGAEGLRLARALAMATYRSPQEFAQRFAGEPTPQGVRYAFPVEKYLLARGDAYANSYRPEAFVCLSESIDLHAVNASAIKVPTTLIAVREDQLVPIADMRSLSERLGGPRSLFEISSLYGHDAFLKETDALRAIFAQVLNTSGDQR